MLSRRLIGAVTRNQKAKILQTSTALVSTLRRAVEVKKVVASSPLACIRRKLLQPFQILTGGKKVASATRSIDRVLEISGLGMSTREEGEGGAAADVTSNRRKIETSPSKEGNPRMSQSIEMLDEPGALDELKASYQEARQGSSSIWLDYSNKSCYVYLYRGGGEPSETLAAFDLDGTLIKPKSNKRIPRSATDWDFFSVWTKVRLQQCLRESKSRFVIFTNQNGVGLNLVPLDEVQKRIELVTRRLDIPCSVFVAVEKDEFRKPRTGMFHLFDASFNDSLEIDRGNSFYCGDAIGYPSHSDADIKFAQRLTLPFLTPEKFLRGVKPKLVPP